MSQTPSCHVRNAQSALDAYETDSGYVFEYPAHPMQMMLADLLHWCDAQTPKIDFDAALTIAREMVAEDQGS